MPTSSSTQEEEGLVVVVTVHLDCKIGSKLLTNFYKNISKFKLNSNIIINNNIFLSNEIIYHTKHKSQSIQSISSSPPQLLYRGTRDGFKSIDFHSRCDDQGPTLTIIKSAEHNQIFGGFTTQNWMKTSPYIPDSSAFLFKIDGENSNQLFRKFNIKQDQKQYAICVYTNYLPIFGAGHDICIYSDCNVNSYSFANFGHTYELPTTTIPDNDEEYESEKPKNYYYLAGSEYFKVSEIEVFKIIH